MGCPSEVTLGDNLVFSITTHDPATGVLTDADAAPSYRVYEDETTAPILTGTMAKLDDVNTTGFYSEQIACTTGNGFERNKSYTVYITAAVGGDTGGISYGFLCRTTVDDVWDEVLTSATHDVGYSAGQRLRYLILTGGQAQDGGANWIELSATEAVDVSTENIISIVGGTGAGQTRLVAEYDDATKILVVDKAWTTVPDASSIYEILPFSSILLVDHGVARAGGADTIQLRLGAPHVDEGAVVFIASGTGTGQIGVVTAFDDGTLTATVSPDWTTAPDATSVYKVLPVGRVIVESLSDAAGDIIGADVWGHSPRTLTQSAASVVSAVTGSTVTQYRATSWNFSLTGMGSVADRTKLYFTLKRRSIDGDAEALVQIEETAGLLYLNGSAATVAGNGTLTVDDVAAGDITVTLADGETDDLETEDALHYDVKKITATGSQLMTIGRFNIADLMTESIT